MALSEHRTAFLQTVEVSRALAARPEVVAAWERESACAGMSVGGLVHHLLNQGVVVARGLREDPQGEVIGLLDHYRQAPWVAASRRGEVDPDQNARDDEAAAAGHAAVLARAAEQTDDLVELLGRSRTPDSIFIPWQGWSLTTSDFLTTRMMEMLVHGDDLAASVGLETPAYPDAAVHAVVGLLSGVAVERHGATAVVRALSRPQRAEGTVSAF